MRPAEVVAQERERLASSSARALALARQIEQVQRKLGPT
jgi:hypothetical protein